MTRRIIFWVMMISVTAGLALNTSLRVQAQEAQLDQIHQTIQKEQERIRVLTAEWHMLKAPARLEGLVSRHLSGMGRIAPEQMISLADLPSMMNDAVQVANADHVNRSDRHEMKESHAGNPKTSVPVAESGFKSGIAIGAAASPASPPDKTLANSSAKKGPALASDDGALAPSIKGNAPVKGNTPTVIAAVTPLASPSTSSSKIKKNMPSPPHDVVADLIAREASSGTQVAAVTGSSSSKDAVRALIARETSGHQNSGVVLASAMRGAQ